MRCQTPPATPEQIARWRTRLPYYRQLKREHKTVPILQVPVRYIVIGPSGSLPLSQIQANHDQLLADFAATNADLSLLPTSGIYGFGEAGSSNISFTPTTLDETTNITRVVSSAEFSGLNAVLNVVPPEPFFINIYLAPLTAGLLGEAILADTGGNNYSACVVTANAVGSLTSPGVDADYGRGRTLTHEVGHCFGLNHPWVSNCGAVLLHDDLPATKNPNYLGNIATQSGGNKDNDLKGLNGTDFQSCTEDQPVPPGYYEWFFNYMEYVTDVNMITFTPDQALTMYSWLDTDGRSILTVTEGALVEVDDTTVITTPVIPIPEDDDEGEGTASSGLSLGAIIGIVVGVLAGLVIIGLIFWGLAKSSAVKISAMSSYDTSARNSLLGWS